MKVDKIIGPTVPLVDSSILFSPLISYICLTRVLKFVARHEWVVVL